MIATIPGQTLTVQIKKSFQTKNTMNQFKDPGILYGDRYYTHADGPFDVPANKAKELVSLGLADVVTRRPETERATVKGNERR